jgi:hypothetical protein
MVKGLSNLTTLYERQCNANIIKVYRCTKAAFFHFCGRVLLAKITINAVENKQNAYREDKCKSKLIIK